MNSDHYRFSSEAKRVFWAQQKAEQRAKVPQAPKRVRKGKPQPGEAAYVQDLENHGPEVADENLAKAQNGGAPDLPAPREEPRAESMYERETRLARERGLARKAQEASNPA